MYIDVHIKLENSNQQTVATLLLPTHELHDVPGGLVLARTEPRPVAVEGDEAGHVAPPHPHHHHAHGLPAQLHQHPLGLLVHT